MRVRYLAVGSGRRQQHQDQRGDADDGPEIARAPGPAAAEATADVQDSNPAPGSPAPAHPGRAAAPGSSAFGPRPSDLRDGLDGGLHLAGLLVAQLGLLLQRVQDHLVQAHVHLHLAGGRGEFAQGQLAGEHFVEDDAQRVDVRAVVHGAGLLDLLRAPCSGECRRHPGRRSAGSVSAVRPRILAMPKSVIFTRPLLVEEDVLGLDVAVDDALVVGELERLADLRDDGQRLLGREPAGLLDLAQVPAVHELHDQVVQRAGRRARRVRRRPGRSRAR